LTEISHTETTQIGLLVDEVEFAQGVGVDFLDLVGDTPEVTFGAGRVGTAVLDGVHRTPCLAGVFGSRKIGVVSVRATGTGLEKLPGYGVVGATLSWITGISNVVLVDTCLVITSQ